MSAGARCLIAPHSICSETGETDPESGLTGDSGLPKAREGVVFFSGWLSVHNGAQTSPFGPTVRSGVAWCVLVGLPCGWRSHQWVVGNKYADKECPIENVSYQGVDAR